MPAFKNQHFVPRCHFKPFTVNRAGRAINLIVTSNGKVVEGAPVKSQCSRSYFYGEEPKLEAALSSIEARYSTLVTAAEGGRVDQELLSSLANLAVLQHMRTEAAVRRFQAIEDTIRSSIGEEDPYLNGIPAVTESELAQWGLNFFAERGDLATDLRTVLIDNRSEREFVTSDDPCSLVNRYASYALREPAFGLTSAGLILTMPITPRLALFSYDPGVYSVRSADPYKIEVSSNRDAEALNAFQMVRNTYTIYFADWRQREQHLSLLAESMHERGPDSRTTFAVFEGERDGVRRYRSLKDGEDWRQVREGIVHTEQLGCRPVRWPAFLGYRARRQHYSNGTGTGYVRKPEWLRGDY
jgi:hypothetical protein